MNDEIPYIDIRVTFLGSELPAGILAKVVGFIEGEVFKVEQNDLEAWMREFDELTPISVDATRYRFDHHQGYSVQFWSAGEGSIILFGIIAGISYWVLDKTLGETISESWRESEAHEKLKKLLLRRISGKATTVAETLSAGPQQIGANVEIQATVKEGERNVVELFVRPAEADITPAGGERTAAAA